jgi:hypothetical protein
VEGPDLSLQQRVAYAIGLVGLPYLWLRVNRLAAARGWGQSPDDPLGQRAWRLLRGLDALHKVCVPFVCLSCPAVVVLSLGTGSA